MVCSVRFIRRKPYVAIFDCLDTIILSLGRLAHITLSAMVAVVNDDLDEDDCVAWNTLVEEQLERMVVRRTVRSHALFP
jgi:hypothetical protein